MTRGIAQVGVLLDRKAAERRWTYGLNVFETYYSEILSHVGIPFLVLDSVNEIKDHELDILIVALADEDDETSSIIWNFAESGGTVIAYAGLAKLSARFGFIEASKIPVGYADLAEIYATDLPLRFLEAIPWIQTEDKSFALQKKGVLLKDEPSGKPKCPALYRFAVGKGFIERWAVNIAKTVVGFQQGTGPVLKDGVPAPDGTGSINEGILKADDGIAMDWDLDRVKSETGLSYFAYPYADLWREAFISHLLRMAVDKELPLPFLGYWPQGISQVAMVSHDSDSNVDESAETTLQVLKENQIHSSWCMIEPGYSPYIYERVKQDGHELAFHYNAVEHDNGLWSETEFARQFQWMKQATGLQEVTSTKNHYTRFEGWGELFEWCESHGILSDQTRGPSKKGNVGFLFGTCQPYFPVSWWNEQNRLYNVLEIGFLTQDLDINAWADSSVTLPFLQQVRRVEGVAHFLFHQIHIHQKETARKALANVVDTARQLGFTFWTGKQVNDWTRQRRKAQIQGIDAEGNVIVNQPHDISGQLVVWLPVSKYQQQDSQEQTCNKYGLICKKAILSDTVSGKGK